MEPIIDKLNDVCLQRIFKFLHLRDLSNMAQVCKRFKLNAEEVFKASNTNLDILQLIEDDDEFHSEWFMIRSLSESFLKMTEQLLLNFGPFIQTLSLTGTGEKDGMDENRLLMLVNRYCTTLKELTLDGMGRSDEFSTDLLPMFARLEKLTVSTVDVCDSFVAIFSDCRDLLYLNVSGVPATMWMEHKFPKLETLDIHDNWEFETTGYESFLKSHDNLRTLRYRNSFIVSEDFAVISKYLLKLETFHCIFEEMYDYDDDEVEVDVIHENIVQLSKLKSLTNLTFMCEESAMKLLVNAFGKENSRIEHFEIVDCRIDSELIVGLCKLQSLKTLKLTECRMDVETLNALTEHLNGLDQIIIKDTKENDLAEHMDKLSQNVCVVNTPEELIRKRPNQRSADILNNLNDDCLMQIFELLPLPDLCNVAEVCQQFLQNAKTVFQLHHTVFNTKQISKSGEYTDMKVAEQLFRNFGFYIKELIVKGTCVRNTIEVETMLYLANKYCVSIDFQSLTLERVNIKGPMRWIFPLLSLFYKLQKLELHACRLDKEFGRFLSFCQIPTIQVFSNYGSTDWMNHTFWYLRNLTLIELWQSESAMKEFIKLNGHLQSLVIHESFLSSKIFKTVARRMPEIRQFCFAGKNLRDRKIRKNVLHLAKCKSLTSLKLNCGAFSVKHLIDEFIKETIPIAELNISFGTVDMELVEKLADLKSLKSLALRRTKMNNVSLVDLVKKLPELNELHIDIKDIDVKGIVKMLPFAQNLSKLSIGCERSNVQIGIVDYRSILYIVQGRGKAVQLRIKIESESRNLFVPFNLLQENSYWVKIDNEITPNLRSVMSDSESESELLDSDSSSADESDDDSVMSVVEDTDVEPMEQ